ncbi:MAG TPA: diaminopimelate epimerase [Candidatus Rubrimentiphilum sp.]|nr:diaminopimelate epimerase [Candidatus Rubrimentiphilum sp.]
MSGVAVTKMHGAFNDFAVIDRRNAPEPLDFQALARRICDRRGGIGCDGMILIEPSGSAGARMRIINADGSEAEMCGNGLRCVARFLSEAGEGDRLRIETASGVLSTEIASKGETYSVRTQIDTPHFEPRALPFANSAHVVVGNPHVVIFEPALDAIDLKQAAAKLQPLFPKGINVHVAVVVDRGRLDVRHWERGVGLTQACGTGSVACAAAAIRFGLAESPVAVHVPGGVLTVEWDGAGGAFLTGPAVRVFDATLTAAHAAAV